MAWSSAASMPAAREFGGMNMDMDTVRSAWMDVGSAGYTCLVLYQCFQVALSPLGSSEEDYIIPCNAILAFYSAIPLPLTAARPS